MQGPKLLNSKQIRDRFGGVSLMTLHRWMAGDFPAPLKISGRNFWRESDVFAWEASRPMREAKRAA